MLAATDLAEIRDLTDGVFALESGCAAPKLSEILARCAALCVVNDPVYVPEVIDGDARNQDPE